MNRPLCLSLIIILTVAVVITPATAETNYDRAKTWFSDVLEDIKTGMENLKLAAVSQVYGYSAEVVGTTWCKTPGQQCSIDGRTYQNQWRYDELMRTDQYSNSPPSSISTAWTRNRDIAVFWNIPYGTLPSNAEPIVATPTPTPPPAPTPTPTPSASPALTPTPSPTPIHTPGSQPTAPGTATTTATAPPYFEQDNSGGSGGKDNTGTIAAVAIGSAILLAIALLLLPEKSKPKRRRL